MATYKVFGKGEYKKFFDENAYRDATNYIFNSQKALYVGGCNITSTQTAAQEMEQTAIKFGKNKGKRVRHSVLSFEKREHVTPEEADTYAQKIVSHYAPEYQVGYAVHTNTEDIHIHFVMNQISYADGHRYRGKKREYYEFLNHAKHVTHLPIIPGK